MIFAVLLVKAMSVKWKIFASIWGILFGFYLLVARSWLSTQGGVDLRGKRFVMTGMKRTRIGYVLCVERGERGHVWQVQKDLLLQLQLQATESVLGHVECSMCRD